MSYKENEQTQERLKIFERITNGFQLSVEDLRIRGEGDVTNTKQSGIPMFKVANLIDDKEIQESSRIIAKNFIGNDFKELLSNKKLYKKIYEIKDQMEGKLN